MILKPQYNRYLQGTLLVMCSVVLLLVLFEQFQVYELHYEEVVQSSSSSLSMPSSQDARIPALSDYISMVERPLFMDTRRHYVPEVSIDPNSQVVEQTSHNQFSLSGIVLAEGQRLALIQVAPGGKIERLKQGESLHGWIVSEINASQATLKNSTEVIHLELQVKSEPMRTRRRTDRTDAEAPVKANIVEPTEAQKTRRRQNPIPNDTNNQVITR